MPKKILRYPLKNIGQFDDYLKIDVVEYKPPGLGTISRGSFALRTTELALVDSIKKSNKSIILPIPQNITDSNAASWTDSPLDPINASVIGSVNELFKSSEPFQEFAKQFGIMFSKAGGVISDGTGQKAAQAALSGTAVGALLGQQQNIPGLVSRATGAVMNQNVELLFNGIQLRQPYTFGYDLVPRSKEESDRVKDIIRTFKKEMTPAKGSQENTAGGFFIKSPNVFKLTYMSGGKPHPFLHKMKPCALTSMSVNYTGAGTYATYSDATPVHMQLALQFQELSLVYAEDYDTEEGLGGVGY